MRLPQLPQDKANHFIYGATIYALCALVFLPFPSLYIVMSIAFFKEFADIYSPPNKFSLADFFATTCGGLFSMLIMYEATRL